MVFFKSFTAVLFLVLVYILQALSGPQHSSFYSVFIPLLSVGSFCLHDYFEVNTLTCSSAGLHFSACVCELPSWET